MLGNSLTLVAVLIAIFFTSCGKGSIEACATFDKSVYLTTDTIMLDASCSEHVVEYQWMPKEGLMMLGDGKLATERFIILPLAGSLSRTIELEVSNARSTRVITKSALIL